MKTTSPFRTQFRNAVEPSETHAVFGTGEWFRKLVFLVALFSASLGATRASDPTGIFAILDKVVIEPNDSAPERVQLWGVFSLADRQSTRDYKAPERGYLYYTLPTENRAAARLEWKDLKALAGTGQVVGFGARFQPAGSLRPSGEEPSKPDPYPVGFGLLKYPSRPTNYAPVQKLREFRAKQDEAARNRPGPATRPEAVREPVKVDSP